MVISLNNPLLGFCTKKMGKKKKKYKLDGTKPTTTKLEDTMTH